MRCRSVQLLQHLILAGILVSGIWGCASTRLDVRVDLYREDPRASLSPSDARGIRFYQALQGAATEAAELAADQKRVANDLFKAFEAFARANTIMGDPNGPAAGRVYWENQGGRATFLSGLEGQLKEHESIIEKKAERVGTAVADANGKLDTYLKLAAKEQTSDTRPALLAAQAALVSASEGVQEALLALAGPFNSSFEIGLVNLWPQVASALAKGPLATRASAGDAEAKRVLGEVQKEVDRLTASIKDIAERGNRVPDRLAERLRSARLGLDPTKAPLMQASIEAIARTAMEIPQSIQLGDRGTTALVEFTTSSTLFNTQIDRLQNPADPVWRVVTSPENAGKWNNQFARSYFYAEGNNAVVVVRDGPTSFRVQQGNNNPTALIEGQLHITRAIANSAISIAGGLSGVPVPTKEGSGGKPSNEPETVSGPPGSKVEDTSVIKARVEREAKIRSGALRNLKVNLAALKEDFSKLGDGDDDGRKALLRRLQAVLSGHEQAFGATE